MSVIGLDFIGEVVSGSVLGGIEVKLTLDNPEGLRVGYPVIVEGHSYNFYCVVKDVVNPGTEVVEQVAGSRMSGVEGMVPLAAPGMHETLGGRLFFSRAILKPIQLIDGNGGLHEPETIPPYFSRVRLASREDVSRIYVPTQSSLPLGSLRGVEDFSVFVDFERLSEKPFAVFGRTGAGKTMLNKLLCTCMLARNSASVLVFDMHQEYGIFSRTNNTPGLKYFFPERVEVFTLDPGSNREARPFLVDPKSITPSDLIIAFQDLTSPMIDAIYAINRLRSRGEDLISAIRNANPDELGERVFSGTLGALQRRVARLERFGFVRSGAGDSFGAVVDLIHAGKSIVLDFGGYGRDSSAYLFVANLIGRRLYDVYVERDDMPRLVLLLEEAHKFLSPNVVSFTVFGRLARETRKFNLILGLVDQRPSRIDDEVRSQLANRLILSLKEPSDINSALAGVPDRGVWGGVVGVIPPQEVLMVGDAIRLPTVFRTMHFDNELFSRMNAYLHDFDVSPVSVGGAEGSLSADDVRNIASDVDRVFGD